MSAAFIGMAGSPYLSGFSGLAFVIGWTGGFVLVVPFQRLAYLRRFGDNHSGFSRCPLWRQCGKTPGGRGSHPGVVRLCGGNRFPRVGVITSRFVNLQFEIGIFVGLAGIPVCSFLAACGR